MLAAALASTLLATGVAPAGATDPAVTRLAAINPTTDTSNPGPAVAVGGAGGYFFVADDGAHGRELHHGDGTGASTLVKDIDPGFLDGNVDNLIALGSALYFTADDGTHGSQLWTSDGTAAGTRMVVDLGAGANPGALVASGGRLFFTSGGATLYVSDGTAAGTRQLTAAPGSLGSLAPFGGGVAFYGDGDAWVSDGTNGGTRSLGLGADAAPDSFVPLNGALYFAATGPDGRELYKSDGTAAGTGVLKAVAPSSPLVAAAGDLLFSGDDGSGDGAELWRTDGTSAGTVQVKDINNGADGSSPAGMVDFGGKVWFNAYDGSAATLWRSDGTSAGTVQVQDAGGDPVSTPGSLTVSGSTLFFGAVDAVDGYELWKSDGTAGGTRMVKDIMSGDGGGFGDVMAAIGSGRVMLTADDGIHGREAWISDGTAAGTTLDDVDLRGLAGATPSVRLGDRQFYVALKPGGDLQLYVTDGTTGGSRQLAGPTTVSAMTVFRDKVYFVGFDSVRGPQLWVTDGTAAGTSMVTTAAGLQVVGGAAMVAAAGGSLYFVGEDPAHGAELWRTDGTTAGTALVKDINNNGAQASNPASLTAFGNRVAFAADDGAHGPELWLSDGTAAGTTMVQDGVAGRTGVSPTGLYGVGCTVYYSGDVPGRPGIQGLWTSNGTAAGTGLVKDINSNPNVQTALSGFVAVGAKVYFTADATGDGPAVWATDGTAAGTRVLDGSVHYAGALTALGTHLLYSAGTDLYAYDTAVGGAPEVLASALPFGTAAPIAVDGDTAYFANADDAHGMELWSTDGTAAGTALAADLTAGPVSSFPVPLGVGSGAPVLTTDTPDEGTVVARLGDTHAGTPVGDDGTGADCLPRSDPPPTTTTTTTTTDTQTQTQTQTTPTQTQTTQTQPPRVQTSPVHATAPTDRRAKPRGLSLRVTRRTATRYTVTGTLRLPPSTPRKTACTGTITLSLTRATRTLGHATAHLTRTCTLRATITIRKLKGHGTLKLTVRFAGNRALQPATSSAGVR